MVNPSAVTLEAIKLVAKRLAHLTDRVVFLGGAATQLLITHKAAPSIRPTYDIDVIVEIATRTEYYRLENELRELGFKQLVGEDAPLCRWTVDGVLVDVMPSDPEILGFSNSWYSATINNSVTVLLDEDSRIRMAKAPYFLATKIEAFHGRGHGDYLASHDIEDVIAVIDGREELVDDIASESRDIQLFLSRALERFMDNRSFLESLPGHLPPDDASQARIPIILQRIDQMVQAGK